MSLAFSCSLPVRGSTASSMSRPPACTRGREAPARYHRHLRWHDGVKKCRLPAMSVSVGDSSASGASVASALPSRTLICTSLTSSSADGQLEEMRAALAAGADLAEIRVDLLSDAERPGWERILHEKVLPVIVTNRASWEGGKAATPESERLALLISAATQGAEFIDVELAAVSDFRESLGAAGLPASTRLILSHHNFSRSLSLEEVEKVYAEMVRAGADICKIAMAASSARDNATVFTALGSANERPMVLLAMGELGQCSRILAPKYGAFLTFASVGDGRESAPGQVATEVLTGMYRFQSIKPSTDVYGVIGNPVSHSMSPALHNAAFADAGIDAVYVPLKVDDDVASFISTMTSIGFRGFSVTIPGKVPALKAMDTVEDVTANIGAMNTVVTEGDGRLRGYNTDWVAAISAIEEGLESQGKSLSGARVLCIGAGGAARGLAYGALARGAKHVVIANRTIGKAEALADEIGAGASAVTLESLSVAAKEGYDVVMNTTSVGMHPDVESTPVSGGKALLEQLGKPLVFDAVYNPLETKLLKDAEAAGCVCVSGVEMFIRQAAEQFRLWFPDVGANVGLMREVVLGKLRS